MFSLSLHHAIALLTFLCHGITTLRLLLYRRGNANYQSHFSFLAWLLIMCTGTSALDILLHLQNVSVTLGQAGIALLLCVLVWRAKGNTAALWRGQ